MATTRKQGADDQNQDATASSTHNQAQNHAQTPDQDAANRGAYAQSSYQNTQAGAHSSAGSQQPQGSQKDQHGTEEGADTNKMLDTALQAGKKWLSDSGVLNNAEQLPQAAKEWGTKAISRVSGLSNTQKVVGGALLLAGVAYLTTRGKGKSSYASHDDDSDYRSGSSYRQGGWAGYAGGKSSSRRNAESGSRSDVGSYGTERRATGSSSSYGRSAAGSSDNDFGSGRESSGSPYANRRGADSSSNYGTSSSSQSGSYGAGKSTAGSSRYESGQSSSPSSASASGLSSGRSSYSSSTPNSNEQDYDA